MGVGRPLQFISQTAPGEGWTTNWVSLFPKIRSFDIGIDHNGLLVAIAETGTEEAPGALMMRRQTPGGNWTAEIPLNSVSSSATPAVGFNADGRMEVFSVSGEVTHRWETSPGNYASGTLGGSAQDVRDVVVASSQNRRLYLFGRGNSGEVQGKDVYIYQTSPSNGWVQNNGAPMWSTRLDSFTGKPVVIRDVSGALQIFVAATGVGVKQISQTLPNSDSWSELGVLGGRDLVPCAAELNKYGALELFAVNADGDVFHTWQTVAGGPWIRDETPPALLRDETQPAILRRPRF